MSRYQSRFGLLVCSALLLLATGCATTAQREAELEHRGRKARSHLNLGVDYLQNDRVPLALRELRVAHELDPANPEIHYALSEAYLRRGRAADAETHLVQALEIHPEYHEARLQLSALYVHLGRYDEAIVQSGILIDDPTFPAVWRAVTNWGWAEFKSGRRAEARAKYEEALDFSPEYWPALLDLGILEAQEGHHLEALERFRQVLEREPGASVRAEANYRIAEVYVSLGKRERAVNHLMAAVAQTPTGRWGKKSEEYLKLLR